MLATVATLYRELLRAFSSNRSFAAEIFLQWVKSGPLLRALAFLPFPSAKSGISGRKRKSFPFSLSVSLHREGREGQAKLSLGDV